MTATPRRHPLRSEVSLVRGVLQGSRTHFDRLYETWFPRIHGYALRRLGERAAAEEVTEAVFAAVVETLPEWRGRSSLAAWILRLTRREVARRLRAETEAQPDRLPRRAPTLHRVVAARRGSAVKGPVRP